MAINAGGAPRVARRHNGRRHLFWRRHESGWAASNYLPLACPLPGLSLRPSALSRRPSPFLSAFSLRLSARSSDSARCLPEESLPSGAVPELAAWEAGGVLLVGLVAAATTAARSRPGPATALLVWALSTIRASETPRTAPSSAPMTTSSWPRRRGDRSTGPPRLHEPCLRCRHRMRPNPTRADPAGGWAHLPRWSEDLGSLA
jgi:hypothetical protein